MNYDYPILKSVIKHYKEIDKDISDFYLVGCQHFLEPQVEVYKGLIEIGMKPENINVFGKIYSTNQSVVDDIKKLSINAYQPEFRGKSFDIEHRENCEELLKNTSRDDVVVLDDGGELIDVFAESNKNTVFAVEQTSSGYRKLENNLHQLPIVNVARSKTKLTQESPFIARLCFERIIEYAERKEIDNPSFVLFGLGPIGEAIREILVEKNLEVNAYDKEDYSDTVEILNTNKPDIVIGATGNQLIKEGEIEKLDKNHNFHFISVSSSDREFPVVKYRNHSKSHQDVEYKNITFANNGFPITFMGNRYEQTPMEMEKTMCLLFGAVAHGMKIGYNQKGWVDVPRELEILINS